MVWPPPGFAPVPGVVDQQFPPEWGAQPYSPDGATVPPFDPMAFAPPQQAEGLPPPFDPALQGAPAQPFGGPLPPDMQQEAPGVYQPPPIPGAPTPFDSDLQGAPQSRAQQAAVPQYVPPGQEQQALSRTAAQPVAPESDIEKYYRLKAEQERAQGEGELANAQRYKSQLDVNQIKRAQHEQAAQEAQGKVAEAWDEVRNTKIDDKALWNGMEGYQKAAAIVGGMIGGFLAARQGGPNRFLEVYQRMVEQNIATQKANLANKTNVAQALDSTYSKMLARFQDSETADYMTAATMYQAGGNELMAKASMMKSDLTRQEGVMAANQAYAAAEANAQAAWERQTKFKLDSAKTMSEIAKLDAETAKLRRPPGAAKPPTLLGTVSDINKDGKIDKLDLTEKQVEQAVFDEFGEPITDPETGALIVGRNAAHAGKMGEGLAKARQARAAFAEYDRLRHEYGRETGGGSGWTEGARKMKSARSLAMKSVKEAWELGAITQSDYDLISGAVPDVPGKTDLTVDHEALPRVMADLDLKVDAQMNSMGYTGSFSQRQAERVKQKQKAFADVPDDSGGIVVDIRTPEQKATEAKAEAAKAERERKAAEQAAPLSIDIKPLGGESGSLLVVTKKGTTIRVPNDKATRKKLQSGAYKLANMEQQRAYQPPSMLAEDE